MVIAINFKPQEKILSFWDENLGLLIYFDKMAGQGRIRLYPNKRKKITDLTYDCSIHKFARYIFQNVSRNSASLNSL